MTVSPRTLSRMRSAALGTALATAAGLSAAAVGAAQAQEAPDAATPTAVIAEEPVAEEPVAEEPGLVPGPVGEPVPAVGIGGGIDGDDCPGCGLG